MPKGAGAHTVSEGLPALLLHLLIDILDQSLLGFECLLFLGHLRLQIDKSSTRSKRSCCKGGTNGGHGGATTRYLGRVRVDGEPKGSRRRHNRQEEEAEHRVCVGLCR